MLPFHHFVAQVGNTSQRRLHSFPDINKIERLIYLVIRISPLYDHKMHTCLNSRDWFLGQSGRHINNSGLGFDLLYLTGRSCPLLKFHGPLHIDEKKLKIVLFL